MFSIIISGRVTPYWNYFVGAFSAVLVPHLPNSFFFFSESFLAKWQVHAEFYFKKKKRVRKYKSLKQMMLQSNLTLKV